MAFCLRAFTKKYNYMAVLRTEKRSMPRVLYTETWCHYRFFHMCFFIFFFSNMKISCLFLPSYFHRDCQWLMGARVTTQPTTPMSMPMRDRAAGRSHWISCHSATMGMIWTFWMIWDPSSRPWEAFCNRRFKKKIESFEGHCWMDYFHVDYAVLRSSFEYVTMDLTL